MKRLIALINGILPFFAALLLQSALITVVDTAYKITAGIEKLPPRGDYYISVISVIICGLVFFYWYNGILGHRKWAFPKRIFKGRSLLLLTGMGIACQLAISGTMSLIRPFFDELFRDYGKIVDSILDSDITVVIIYVIIIAPITEELIFRGVMLKRLREALPFFAANLLQAVIFGIYHWNVVQGVYAFGIGLLLGYVSGRFRSITASILLHMAINASSFLVGLFPDIQAVYVIAVIAGGLTILGGLWILGRFESEVKNT